MRSNRHTNGTNGGQCPPYVRAARSVGRVLPAIGLVVLSIIAGTGCQTARVVQPITAQYGGSDADAQLEFWHTLADQPVTSNDDALHGLLLFLDGTDPANTYDERVTALKSRGLLPRSFDAPPDEAVSRGTLAVAITKALDLPGGWVMRLSGPTPRYATRELVFMDLYPPSSPNQTFSGTEFLGIIGKLEDYQRDGRDGLIAGEPASGQDMDGPAPQQPGLPPEPIQPENPE